MKINNGFTIIELIMVISIISVLSAIIVVNVGSVLNKSKDTTIRENMFAFYRLALDYYNNHNQNYGAFCQDDATEDLFNTIPAYEKVKEKFCHSNAPNWVVCAQLNFPEDRSKAWCIDTSGVAKQIDSADCKQGIQVCP